MYTPWWGAKQFKARKQIPLVEQTSTQGMKHFLLINIFMMFQLVLKPEGTGIVWEWLNMYDDQQRFLGPKGLLSRQNPWSLHHHQHLKVAMGHHTATRPCCLGASLTFSHLHLIPLQRGLIEMWNICRVPQPECITTSLSSRAGQCPGKGPNPDAKLWRITQTLDLKIFKLKVQTYF